MTDYCRGCYSIFWIEYCPYIKHNSDGKCPCSKCVVKVMCDQPCDKYENFKDYHEEASL